ncbi:MAG: MBL fold metallo-hydrolase [Sphingobacteriales bacterium]|jgi:glyoxylase-like metal-dependent hydrolase (beta-lactamase superfamily II)|nr:MBL fold metallo-hydrolase [Sphingobacteriales bacterium]
MISVQSFTANPYQENGYVLFDESKDCVIIDPGAYTSQEQNELSRFIESQKLTPVKLLNTHCHIDHVLGNAFVHSLYGLLPEFHKLELELLHAIPGYAPQMGIRYELSPLPKTFLSESGKIAFGQSELELIFAPGHSPGHLCFHSSVDNFLIGGDVLFYQSIGRTDLPGGNHQQLLDNIKHKLFNLPNDCVVYPGHGPSTQIGFEKAHNPFLL